jgi:hypothetical protein
MRPRALRVANPEDELANQNLMERFLPFFEIVPINGVRDALVGIARAGFRAPLDSAIDIILLDVNMEKDPGKGKWNWGTSDGVAPYGPLLALPYLNVSSLTQFAPYSEFWQRPEVNRNGYVLLSLAFIFSAVRDRPVGLDRINRLIARGTSPKFPHEALPLGLIRFRRRLLAAAKRCELTLLDVSNTIRNVEDLISCATSLKAPLNAPGTEEAVSVNWVHRNGEVDSVMLTSMFADLLDFSSDPTQDDLKRIVDELRKWPSAATAVWDEEHLYNSAVEILIQCGACDNSGDILAESVDNHNFVLSSRGPAHLLRRTVMLFAWVIAWYLKVHRDVPNTWESVRKLFYHGGRETTFDHRYKVYLGQDRKTVSYEVHRTPFSRIDSRTEEFVRQSYMLTDDRVGFLVPRDLRLCNKFAEDGLVDFLVKVEMLEGARSWKDTAARPYPRWMKESEFDKMPWGAQRIASVDFPKDWVTHVQQIQAERC